MTNLLAETVQCILENNMTPKDVEWIGSLDGEYSMTWDEYEELANFEYDSGFGSQAIATDLVIVMKDGSWMERGEYDGSEWWECHFPNKMKPKPNAKKITNLGGDAIIWDTLKELNK